MCKRIFVEAVLRGWSKRKRDEGTKAGRERTRKRPCITCFKEHWIPVLSTHIFSANTYSEHSGARWNMRRNKRRASRRNSVSPFPISGHQATHPSITWAHHPQKTRSCKGHPLLFPPSFARPSISDLAPGGWGWGVQCSFTWEHLSLAQVSECLQQPARSTCDSTASKAINFIDRRHHTWLFFVRWKLQWVAAVVMSMSINILATVTVETVAARRFTSLATMVMRVMVISDGN